MKHDNPFTVAEWLDCLENRHQQEIQLGLSRIKAVAKTLDLMWPEANIVTVAGTNGKGSTVAALEAIYLASGYQVAAYTSPHLLVFNERIRINQQQITDSQLCAAFSAIEQGRGSVPLTYFEMTTLAALWHFNQHELDLIILETGLGGRLDAVNCIDADLSIITTIDFDHEAWLGHTKEAIGYEKAGILRPNKPWIFADKNPPASVVNQAFSLDATGYICGQAYDCRFAGGVLEFMFQDEIIHLVEPRLHYRAVAAAIMASLLMQAALPVDRFMVKTALEQAVLAGRLQFIAQPAATLLDVSHNAQAVEHLAAFIGNVHPGKTVHAVFSALKDKDLPGLIAPLLECVTHWYPASLTARRAAPAEQLAAAFSLYGRLPFCYPDPGTAYQAACRRAGEGDLILVYGSFFTVAAVLAGIGACGQLPFLAAN